MSMVESPTAEERANTNTKCIWNLFFPRCDHVQKWNRDTVTHKNMRNEEALKFVI